MPRDGRLAVVSRRMTRKTIVFGVVATVLVAGGVAARVFISRVHRKADDDRKRLIAGAERALPVYVDLGRKVDADPFFAATRPDLDAGPWLNPRVAWDTEPRRSASQELALPDALADAVKKWSDDWVDHAGEVDFSRLDLSWMAGLSRFGRWNVIPGGPLEEIDRPRFESLPIPNFLHLLTWAKLRLLAARARGDSAAASAEVRQLAYLCHSTELLIGAMVGNAILRAERRAYDAAAEARQDLKGWPAPHEIAWLDDARAVQWAGAGYVAVFVPEDLYERARTVKVGRCTGLGEAALPVLVRRRLGLGVPPWLERELDRPDPPCRLDVARWFLAKGVSPLETGADSALSRTERLGVRLFPATTVRLLESIATPEWFAKLESRAASN